MAFDEAQLKAAGFSKKKIEKLLARQRGGTSGQRGYVHQRRYALLRVAELVHTESPVTVEMEALCPVDDVVVTGPGLAEYAQCKVSEAETWTANDKKLTREFRDQHRLLLKSKIPPHTIQLVLVVADDGQCGRLLEKMPSSLLSTSCTRVECFPLGVPEHHPWTIPRLAGALDDLLPPTLRDPNWRESVFKELNHAAGDPWQPLAAGDLLESAGRRGFPIAYPRPRPWSITPDDWAQASAVLGGIPGLVIDCAGGVCCYRAPLQSGLIARCDTPGFARFVKDVIARGPQTMKDFLEVRPCP